MTERTRSGQPSRDRRSRRRWFTIFLVLGLLIVIPEIGLRLVTLFAPPTAELQAFREIGDAYPALDELVHDRNALRFDYHDYYLYAPRETTSGTISISGYFGARNTPSSAEGHDVQEVIWAFGGSTLQNLEAVDELTLANQVVRELNARGVPSRLHNFAVRGFQTSLELTRFQDLLGRVPESERPTTVIFYHGFQDARDGYVFGAGRLPSDVSSQLRDMIERDLARLLVHSGSQWLSRYSILWRRLAGQRIQRLLHPDVRPDNSDRNLAATVETYVVNVRAARGICEAFGIRCLFLLQPLLVTRSPISSFEEQVLARMDPVAVQFTRDFYARVTASLSGAPDFHDLSGFYDASEEAVFFDSAHTSPTAGVPIGEEIAKRILDARTAGRPPSQR